MGKHNDNHCCCNGESHDHKHVHEHEHAHGHDHDHDHAHNHNHDHEHNESNFETQKSDLEKIKILLPHWIEHNKEHQKSYEMWALKADAMDKPDISQLIRNAVELMDKANQSLIEAKSILK